jgi:DMSO/TMAO reductase YedYZ molybdopterin-dependent catalytic subunit
MQKIDFKFLAKILIIILIIIIIAYTISNLGNDLSEESIKLTQSEIREYKGENLSSIIDFRENSIKGPQHIDINNYSLKITGLVENKLDLTYDQVLEEQSYEKVVTLYCVEGWDAKILWKGVLLKDLIEKAGPLDGEGANTVIFKAADGYTSSLPLAYIYDQNILLASQMNSLPLLPERGFPFQVVAESKWGYKWVKWITEIELSNDSEYKGFWESRGYSNSADLNDYYFE